MSNSALEATTSAELVSRIKNLNNYEQTVIYYGPASLKDLESKLKTMHPIPAKFAVTDSTRVFKQVAQTRNQVLFTDYDMVQAETRWIRNTENYDPSKNTLVKVFNNYFGGGMG